MPQYPFRLPDDAYVFRALMGEDWVDRLQDPWAATQVAFLRQKKDIGGVSVRPTAALCYRKVSPLKVQGIARIIVSDIRMLVNPITGDSLDAVQDSGEHITIHNVPFHDDDPANALDLATDIADLAIVLSRSDWLAAVESNPILRSGVKAKIVAMLRSLR